MLDVHPPHHVVHGWRDFFLHIATISVGLLIALGLEQTVEAIHHHHQREQLEQDLRTEAEHNERIIQRDLRLIDMEPWFAGAVAQQSAAAGAAAKVAFQMPKLPCLPGSFGSAEVRYFAPSQAVWTTAAASGLVSLLPTRHARLYARLAHNYDLLALAREDVYRNCNTLESMQKRFASAPAADGSQVWTMSAAQAESFAQTAATTQTAVQGLLFRLRWSKIYEEGIVKGEDLIDDQMMNINQERFEDPPQH